MTSDFCLFVDIMAAKPSCSSSGSRPPRRYTADQARNIFLDMNNSDLSDLESCSGSSESYFQPSDSSESQ